jgi:nuclear pore complex protein Nup205
LQVANDLDLDELEAAELFHKVKIESEASGRSRLTCSVIRFHQRRKELLDCLRLILQTYIDVDQEDHVRERIQAVVRYIIQPPDTADSSRFVARCLSSMRNIKNWLGGLSAKLDALEVVNREESSEDKERLEYQRVSLVKQHESLGIIVYYLSKNYAAVADFESILASLKSMDRLDNLLCECGSMGIVVFDANELAVHYFPALSSYISHFGSQDGGTSIAEARALNERLLGGSQTQWSLTYVHAAFRCWWLAEYSSWYGENYDGSLPQKDLDAGK